MAEAVAVVLGTDELPPFALLLAPARRHVHRLVEGVLVHDLNEGFEKHPVRCQLEALRDVELFAVRSTVHEEAHFCGQADGIDDQLAVLVTPDRFAEPGRRHIFGVLVGYVDAASEGVALPQHVHHIHLRALYEAILHFTYPSGTTSAWG